MVISIGLLIVIMLQEGIHYVRDKRKDALISELMDKIKAKDFTEYKMMTEPAPVFEPIERDDSSLYAMEIEDNKR